MHVHPGAVVLEDRLGHERDRLSGPQRDVLDDVLVEHQPVRHRQEVIEAHVDLALARGANLVMMNLDRDPELAQDHDHLRAEVLVVVHRRNREVPLLVTRLVAEVAPTFLGA